LLYMINRFTFVSSNQFKVFGFKKQTPMTTRFQMLLLGLWLLLSTTALPAQGWKRTYTPMATIFRSVQTADGGFLSCGTNELNQLQIIKTDFDGALILKKAFTSIGRIDRAYLSKSVDGNYHVAVSDTSTFMTLIKITPKGDSLWKKKVPVSFSFHDFQTLSDGNIGAIGRDLNQKPIFIKLNALGDTVWTKRYANPTSKMSGFTEDAEGSIIWQINDQTLSQPVLWYIGKNGNTLSTVNLNSNIMDFFRLIELKDGNLVICNSAQVFKIRTDGRFVWSVNPAGANEIINIVPTDDNGVAVLTYGINAVLSQTELIKLDANGNTTWKRKMTEDVEANPGADFSLFVLFSLIQTEDKGFVLSGRLEQNTNNTNKKLGYLLKTNGDGTVYPNEIKGRIVADLNNNCKADITETPIKGWVIRADGGPNKILNATTDVDGNYSFQVDTGKYKLAVFAPNNLWKPCYKDSVITVTGFGEIDTFNIPVSNNISCSGLRVDIGTPLLRRCFDNTYTVSFCNNGTRSISNVYVEVVLDTNLLFQNASLPIAVKTGNKYRFNIGNLNVLQCGNFNIVAKVSCDNPSVLGRTLGVEAHIYPDSICPSWNGATVEVGGRCDRDSVRFLIRNTGTSTTSKQVNYSIIVDEVVFLNGNTRTPVQPNETRFITVPSNGKTYRFEAQQETGHPTNQNPSTVVEGCGRNLQGGISTGFVLQLPEADGDPFIDIDYQTVISSSGSNELYASPIGYQSERKIKPNTDLEYMIRFQNVGTDTAFTIIIRDTLPDFLEPSSVEFGASSHAYKGEVIGKNVIKITFENIRLADSFINVAASRGFVKFRVHQKPSVPLGTKISNKAAIYFDFNKPIYTNTLFHTVAEGFVTAIIDPAKPNAGLKVKVYPNPFVEQATFEIESDPLSIEHSGAKIFRLYDIVGRLVRTERFNTKQFIFERKDLPRGIYIFNIENQGRNIGSGKLMIEK
jgi:hypothetical protein